MALPTPVALLVLALVLGSVAYGHYREIPDPPDWETLRSGLIRLWALTGVLGALVVFFGTPADVFLGAPSVGTLVDGFLFGFIAYAGTMLLSALAVRQTGGVTASEATLVLLEQPRRRKLGAALTNAVAESLVFYGYAAGALVALGAPTWAGALVGTAGFVVTRTRWRVREGLQHLPGALVLAGLLVHTESLYAVVLVRLVYETVTILSGSPEDYAGES